MARLPGPLAFDLSAITYVPGPTNQFTQLTTDTLSNSATDSDGFSNLYNVPATALSGDIAALGTMDTNLADADFLAGAFDSTEAAPITLDIASGSDQLDNALADFGVFAQQPPPTIGDPTTANVIASAATKASKSPLPMVGHSLNEIG